MLIDGNAPAPGQIFTNHKLAQTFRTLAKEGKDGFYRGRIAQAIVDVHKQAGGTMELEDLANHTSTLVEPISYTYADEITLHECPPNGQGLTALIALGLLDVLREDGVVDMHKLEHNSPEYLHLLMCVLLFGATDRAARSSATRSPMRRRTSATPITATRTSTSC